MSHAITSEQVAADYEADERSRNDLEEAMKAYSRRKYGEVNYAFMCGALTAGLQLDEPKACANLTKWFWRQAETGKP